MKYLKKYESVVIDWNDEDFDEEEVYNGNEFLPLYIGAGDGYRFGKYEIHYPLKTEFFFKIDRNANYEELCDSLFDWDKLKELFMIYNPKMNNGTGGCRDFYYMSINNYEVTPDNKFSFGFMPSIEGGSDHNGIDGYKWYEDNHHIYLGNIEDL